MKKNIIFDRVRKNRELIALGTAILLSGSLMGCAPKQIVSIDNPNVVVQEEKTSGEETSTGEKKTTKRYDLISEKGSQSVTDLGTLLLQKSRKEGNAMVSPASIYVALAMTAEGADENTLAQMEEVLGMPVGELREFANAYMETLEYNGENKVAMANSVWTNDLMQYTYDQEIKNLLQEKYRAQLVNESFDAGTAGRINAWVEEHTDQMIKQVLGEVPPEAAMYLINALVFDAKWETEYDEEEVRSDIFTKEDGTKQDIDFMNSVEGVYLEDENTVGTMKYYKDGRYAFVGLLPAEGMSMDDYVAELTGEKIKQLMDSEKYGDVYTMIPEFEADYKDELSDYLNELGMEDAFLPETANFQKFTEEENHFYINRVLHQTHVEVNHEGTKAAAVTAVEIATECVSIEEPADEYYVYLNRPFVYMIWDVDQNMPLFIGTMEGVQ